MKAGADAGRCEGKRTGRGARPLGRDRFALPDGDLARALDRIIDLAIPALEKRKFAATGRSRVPRRRVMNRRTIPARVKRAVWQRDQGQCTFVSAQGRRCRAREFLEFDHVVPVARGGKATVEGIRLRCRAHNQYEAERMFGRDFMKAKRERRVARRTVPDPLTRDLISCLRNLGYTAEESRRAASANEAMVGASLEDRIRMSLAFFRRKP